MKIAAVQISSGPDIEDNLARAVDAIERAADQGARLIVLPEATSQSFDSGRLDKQAQQLDGPFARGLAQVAEERDVVVVAGMFCPADSVEKGDKTINRVYNTALITGGGYHQGYDKIHTYDAFNYRESDTVRPGDELVTVEVDGITVGIAICYDIRFPEMFKELGEQGAEVIVVPTSWADGPKKLPAWRTLAVARALDYVGYIVAAGQARPGGDEEAGNPSGPTGIGYSVIVDPTGERLAEAGYTPEIIYADVDSETVAKARKALPLIDGGAH
ncbi:amidohydrolase [Corynebacterium yudongzhengii]|uniref:Amidohydrolase n=1 Tax=Corynebacterium yudongzhengii TaxID=2080740 RepID=A0A2U1T4M5_9CORY|nr:carbon-nitrogen hydrolase family protein [Corynebacterium yudongzhengii]AWB82711.1 amidohydrolase [Corynebacterium yudongzhengii]PWC00954.1 amidohydrolase [Corynebacterium yudongzhengii]